MLKNINVIILENDEKVDIIMSVAAKYDLSCTYKIGMYGKHKQHEMQVIGPQRKYKKFIKELGNVN